MRERFTDARILLPTPLRFEHHANTTPCSHTARSRSTLLLLDRSSDPLTPLIHEFTYEAMVNDLLSVDEDKISYEAENNKGVKEAKDVLLNENDDLWCELRHMHIADVITLLSDRIRGFVKNNGGAQLAQNAGSDMSLSEMASALKQLPEYRETMAKVRVLGGAGARCPLGLVASPRRF